MDGSHVLEYPQQLPLIMGCQFHAYHPIANGIIERFHRQLNVALKAYPNPTHWVDSLPMVLLCIRTALKTDLRCSVAELVYGTTLRIPGECFITE